MSILVHVLLVVAARRGPGSHSSISRMLEGNSGVVDEAVVVWRPIAGICCAEKAMDLSRSLSSGGVTYM